MADPGPREPGPSGLRRGLSGRGGVGARAGRGGDVGRSRAAREDPASRAGSRDPPGSRRTERRPELPPRQPHAWPSRPRLLTWRGREEEGPPSRGGPAASAGGAAAFPGVTSAESQPLPRGAIPAFLCCESPFKVTFPDEWGVGRQLGVLFLPRRISIWRADF